MNDITSLPESLRAHIQEAASSVLATRPPEGLQPSEPVQRVIAEIARQNPELFALLIIANSGFTGIVSEESEEVAEDQVVETYDGYTHRKVTPMKTVRRVRREVRFLPERGVVTRTGQ